MTTNNEDIWIKTRESLGKIFGYKECCIKAFGGPRTEPHESEKQAFFTGTGYVVCDKCLSNMEILDIIVQINIRRNNSLPPFPIDLDDVKYIKCQSSEFPQIVNRIFSYIRNELRGLQMTELSDDLEGYVGSVAMGMDRQFYVKMQDRWKPLTLDFDAFMEKHLANK